MQHLPVLSQTEFFLFFVFSFFPLQWYANERTSFRVIADFITKFVKVRRSCFTYVWSGSALEAWWKACLCIRSFHSSIIFMTTPPVRNALHSPLILLEPKNKTSVGCQWISFIHLVRWAESGGWCCERSLKRPSFGCLSSRAETIQKCYVIASPFTDYPFFKF